MKKFAYLVAAALLVSACTQQQEVQTTIPAPQPMPNTPAFIEPTPVMARLAVHPEAESPALVQTAVVAAVKKTPIARYFISTMNLCKLPEKFDRTFYIAAQPQQILPASIIEVAKNQLIHDGFTVVEDPKKAFWKLSFKEEQTQAKIFSRNHEEPVSAYLLTLSYTKGNKPINGTELYIVTNTSDPLRLIPDLEEISAHLFDCNKQQMFACKLAERTNGENCLKK